jgi:short-subunit dehydrogenase
MLGPPSILINNAGIAGAHRIIDTSPEFLRKIFEVNVLSNWWTVKAFLPDMITSNRGHIVTVASMASFITVGAMVDYCSTKAAVLSFHEGMPSLACVHGTSILILVGLNQELKQSHGSPRILTTSVHPNWVNTPLLEPYLKAIRASNQPIIEPKVVADAVVKQIVDARGGQVFLPAAARDASRLRGLPNWMQESYRGIATKSILPSLE